MNDPVWGRSIGERLRDIRIKAGFSQHTAAKRMGCFRETITEIESGRRKLTAMELWDFARLYNVSPVEIMGEDTRPEIVGGEG